jgi:hypothetical protein
MKTDKTIKRVRPISPCYLKDKLPPIPNEVISAFNELIIMNYCKGVARVNREAAIRMIIKKLFPMEMIRDKIFIHGWLNIESYFRKSGWKVSYDRPGYNENYDPVFIFTVDEDI